MIPDDIHTSDITAACPQSVELRLQGKIVPQGTGALFLGNLWHAAVRKYYEDAGAPLQCVTAAMPEVIEAMREEGRELTKATDAGRHEDAAQVERWLSVYAAKYAIDGKVHLEVPCRLTLDVDGVPQNFASHIDILQVTDNNARIRDWKTGKDSPTPAYLVRNLQLALYWLMVRHGQVMIDGEWQRIGMYPDVEWLHVRSLSPYGKAVEATDDDGVTRKFAKGDFRPYSSVVKRVIFLPDNEGKIVDALATRVRMFRQGLHPTMPDTEGCFVCESNQFCPQFGGVA